MDVLAVRTADAVAAWLAAHPAIRIISRDRHGPYADGVRRGAPQAREVADRFHLVSNLREAVQRELGRLRRFLVVPHDPRRPAPSSRDRGPPQRRTSSPVDVVEQQDRLAHERRATAAAHAFG